MIWKELFPWAHQTSVTLSITSPKVINENIIICKSTFSGICGDSTLEIADQSYYLSIDYCIFFDCSSLGSYQKAGCAQISLLNYGSVSVTRTIADSCMSSLEGNFALLKVSEFGSIFVLMSSMDKCAPDCSSKTYHSILMKSGTQILKNINNTCCNADRHAGFSNAESLVAEVDFCNIVDNLMTMACVHAITGNADVRRVNYISNTLGTGIDAFDGVIARVNSIENSRAIMSDCVLIRNSLTYLISVYNADITLIGCNLDSSSFKKSGADVILIESHVRDPITMTLMAGAGKHADIPYGIKTVKFIKPLQVLISATFLGIIIYM